MSNIHENIGRGKEESWIEKRKIATKDGEGINHIYECPESIGTPG